MGVKTKEYGHDIDMLRARVLELEREMERLRADSSALRERLAALEARDERP